MYTKTIHYTPIFYTVRFMFKPWNREDRKSRKTSCFLTEQPTYPSRQTKLSIIFFIFFRLSGICGLYFLGENTKSESLFNTLWSDAILHLPDLKLISPYSPCLSILTKKKKEKQTLQNLFSIVTWQRLVRDDFPITNFLLCNIMRRIAYFLFIRSSRTMYISRTKISFQLFSYHVVDDWCFGRTD